MRAGLVGSGPMMNREALAMEVASGCKLKGVRMTSPTRRRRNRNRTRHNAAATAESVREARAHEIRGGGGANLLTLDIRTRGDLGLIRQAARQRWPVTPEKGCQIVDHIFEVGIRGECDRFAIRCARVIFAMTLADTQDELSARKLAAKSPRVQQIAVVSDKNPNT